jgi:hypothetical protein
MSLLPLPEAIYPDPTTAFNAIQLHAKDISCSVDAAQKKRYMRLRVKTYCGAGN